MCAAFKEVSKIKYEGPKSKNPLAFKYYNPSEKVEGKTSFVVKLANYDGFVGVGAYR